MHPENVDYLHLAWPQALPDISERKPFKSVVVVETDVSNEDRDKISEWLVDSGCLYMMAWGLECSKWDDSVDWANMEQFDSKEIPDEAFVMTTWHEKETLKEVFEFSKKWAMHESVELPNTLILHIADKSQKESLLEEFTGA